MRRRELIAASMVLPSLAAGPSANAGETPAAGGASLGIAGVGLPIITEGRIRNYIFVSLRLHLGGSATPESMRPKEAYLRDALVRAGHRTPFVVPNDWTRIDTAALSASLMRAAATIAGRRGGDAGGSHQPGAATAHRRSRRLIRVHQSCCVAPAHLARFRRISPGTQTRVRCARGDRKADRGE